jgi:hypothetical protein
MGRSDIFGRFGALADLGKELMGSSTSHIELQKYAFHLGTICRLMKRTHLKIVEKLDAIEDAGCPNEAIGIAEQLEQGPLTESFRASGLCDDFPFLGSKLKRLIDNTDHLNDQKKEIWFNFFTELENREGRVAALYAHEIQKIGDLALGDSPGPDLARIKAAARKAQNVLTSQMADFDSLAIRFEQLV